MESHVEDRLLFDIEKRFTVQRKWIRRVQVAHAVRQLDTDIIRAKVTRSNHCEQNYENSVFVSNANVYILVLLRRYFFSPKRKRLLKRGDGKKRFVFCSVSIGPQNVHTNGSIMWQGSQYLNFDVQSGYHTLEEDFGLSFNAAVNSSLQDLNAIRIYVDHNYGTNSFNTSVLLQVRMLRFRTRNAINGLNASARSVRR